ncbi:hypothetical protein [Streptomyces sp. CB01881]|uniref:hypothetical protein n=1 Tax=Streptomyces sp. CB01881 TaxID=2078691 RepID=UPI000CDBB41F|nr:hypothetical protein [Streptomyces sp. CB01881]AUY53316.1 hypothetical protein C2142_35425 [Streptomyces sp. CB01881]TYC69472.1 hypothetical protein EH183_35490 [Streptomyces sp. CB01881]
MEGTVRLGAAPEVVEATVRLTPARPTAEERTVKPAPDTAAPAPGGPDAAATVRLDAGEAVSATFLDPRAWGGADAPASGETATHIDTTPAGETVTRVDAPGQDSAVLPAPVDPGATPRPGQSSAGQSSPDASSSGASRTEQPLAPGELRRFGPGVPPQAAAVWHGAAVPDAQQPRRPRRVGRWLVPVAVLLAVLAFLYWRFATPALAVTGVGVTTDPAGPACGGTAVITAAVETNGGTGTLHYRWLRSDGTTSGEIAQDVRSGAHRTDLVLRWSFEGRGDLQATATLEILSPDTRTAAASFPYHCS